MLESVHLQLYWGYQWHTVAEFTPFADTLDIGYRAPGRLTYATDYVTQHINATNNHAVSAAFPVDFTYYKTDHWPAFLLDILPAGAGRRAFLNLNNLPDQGPKSDWFLLNTGTSSPPGNIRIQEAIRPENMSTHPGFERTEIITRHTEFLEYARSHGAPVAGSTGAQGDAPKFLLTQDSQGKWHADGALADACAYQHFLVKFPRGNHPDDRLILRHEAIYYHIAAQLGLRVGEPLEWQSDTLFVPRFDRQISPAGLIRHGLESLCSLAGVAEFGQTISLFQQCNAFVTRVNNPTADLVEFLKRDIANIALGNTDNHARNQAVLKHENGEVLLSPFYDLAPMMFDPEGIVRLCRWEECEQHTPNWWQVIQRLQKTTWAPAIDWEKLTCELRRFKTLVAQIPTWLVDAQADQRVIDRVKPRIANCLDILMQEKS